MFPTWSLRMRSTCQCFTLTETSGLFKAPLSRWLDGSCPTWDCSTARRVWGRNSSRRLPPQELSLSPLCCNSSLPQLQWRSIGQKRISCLDQEGLEDGPSWPRSHGYLCWPLSRSGLASSPPLMRSYAFICSVLDRSMRWISNQVKTDSKRTSWSPYPTLPRALGLTWRRWGGCWSGSRSPSTVPTLAKLHFWRFKGRLPWWSLYP